MRIKCFKTYQVVEFEGNNTTFFHVEDKRWADDPMELTTVTHGNMDFIIVKRKGAIHMVPFYNVQYCKPMDEAPFLKEFEDQKPLKSVSKK